MESLVSMVLEGRTRKSPIADIVITRRPHGRVLKDIHSNNLLPWYRARYPRVPVVFAVRHPIATARSRQRLGDFFGLARYLETQAGRCDLENSPVAEWLPVYDAHRNDPDELVRFVAEWCIENAYPLRWVGAEGVEFTYYETAVREPVSELTRLGELCSYALGGDEGEFVAEDLRRPSRQDRFGKIAEAENSRDWDRILTQWTSEVPPATTRRCVEVLADFGLDRFYGEDPLPVPQPA